MWALASGAVLPPAEADGDGALLHKLATDGGADAGAAAGDEDDAALQTQVHGDQPL